MKIEIEGYGEFEVQDNFAELSEDQQQEIANELQKHTGALINESGEDKENIFFKLPPLLR